jgi:hypothetical protein
MGVGCMLVGLTLLGGLSYRSDRGPGFPGLISGMGLILLGGYLHTY